MPTSDSLTQSSPKSKISTSVSSSTEKEETSKETKGERSKVLDYMIVIFFMAVWFTLFLYRNYPGLLGVRPKPKAPVK